MKQETFTVAYPKQMRPTQFDGAHFICYLNESPAVYYADEDSEPTAGFSYTGTMPDGGTLVACDELNRDKLINAVIRTKYLQTEEDAIKTHQLMVLNAKAGLSELSEEKIVEYMLEWNEFEQFRKEVIELVDSWLE